MDVATCFYYEKVRRTMRAAVVWNLLKIITSSIIFRRILTPFVIIFRKKHDTFSSFAWKLRFTTKSLLLKIWKNFKDLDFEQLR